MIPVNIETLVFSLPPSPSVVVLRPTGATKHDTRALPIWIGPSEASAIGIALEDKPHTRPMTHDLMTDIIHSLQGEVERVLIDRVEGSTFYATIVINQDGETLRLDARPSDSIALALRMHAPLFVSEEVLDFAALPYPGSPSSTAKQSESEIAEFRKFLESVQPEDFEE